METSEEWRESSSRGFLSVWPVHSAYGIIDGIIVPQIDKDQVSIHHISGRSIRKCYMPLGRAELPGQFARVSTGGVEEALRFVHNYGLLGYHASFSFTELIGLASKDFQAHDPDCPGDPVSWVLAHSANINLVLELIARLNDEKSLLSVLTSLMVHDPKTNSRSLSIPIAFRGNTYPATCLFRIEESPLQTALNVIAHILHENLQGASRRIQVLKGANGKFQLDSGFEIRNLLDAIYWLVADAAVHSQVRICDHCKQPFVCTNLKIKYCPSPLDYKGAISQCMNRAKQSRHRSKIRAQKMHLKTKLKGVRAGKKR